MGEKKKRSDSVAMSCSVSPSFCVAVLTSWQWLWFQTECELLVSALRRGAQAPLPSLERGRGGRQRLSERSICNEAEKRQRQ